MLHLSHNWFVLLSNSAVGTIFSSTDTVCTLQVCNTHVLFCSYFFVTKLESWTFKLIYVQVLQQDDTPLLYSLVFGEGVVNDATSVVLFNAIQKLDVSRLDGWAIVRVVGDFLYLFSTSTLLGVAVCLDLSNGDLICLRRFLLLNKEPERH